MRAVDAVSDEDEDAGNLDYLVRERNTAMKKCMDSIISGAALIAATPHSALNYHVRAKTKTVEIIAIDEAAACDESHLMQCIFRQIKIFMAMDVYQLGIYSLSKTMPGKTRVNPYENQYTTSLGERLQALGWPLDSQPYQLRMLPGLFDPAWHCCETAKPSPISLKS